jgi:N-sulfoglucosamine sulfohydrolase
MTTPASSPSILIMTCHDLGRFLGCYGIPTVRTPNIDALATDGLRFTQYYCTAPQCSSSRAAMYTGRYPHANGVMGLTHGDFGWDINPDEELIGQVLQRAGYTTALLGIHHESRRGTPEEVAARCGMDEIVPPGTGEELVLAAIERLWRYASQKRPFYMQIGFHEPHRASIPGEDAPEHMGFTGDYIEPDTSRGVSIPPYLADDAGARIEMAEIQGALSYLDEQIDLLLDALTDTGLERDTIVVLTTDHGLALPRAKCSLYDPGIEGAFILRYPARDWSGGRVFDNLLSNVDLFPTLLELAGLPVSPRVHGRSIVPLVEGGDYTPRDCIFSELTYHDYYDPLRAIRSATHKLIVNFSTAPSFMDPSQSWRPRSRPRVPGDPATAYHPPLELYDLTSDPHEWHNLATDPAHAATLGDLLTRLHTWMVDTGDPLLHGAVTSPSHTRALETLKGARQ